MRCLGCNSDGLEVFLDLGIQPLANKYPKAEEYSNERRVPLRAAFCPECELVQLTPECLVSREELFLDYYYLSSVNQGLVEHFEKLAHLIATRKPRLVVDIGSNDGILLQPLKELGVRAVGIEPGKNIAKEANAKGLSTMNRFWDLQTALEVEAEYGKADVMVASNIFTHILDPQGFLTAVQAILSSKGQLIIEIEYLPNILGGLAFERFYSDHTFYFTLRSLGNMLSRHGLRVCDSEYVETHGGSLRAHIQRQGTCEDADRSTQRWRDEGTSEYGKLYTYKNFANDIRSAADQFREQLEGYKRKGTRVAGYGAPARLSTITNYAGIGPDLVQYVIDDSPLKQGRFSPGMHIPIVGLSTLTARPADILVVFAWNYLEDIKKKLTSLQPKPELMIPIPPKMVSW